MKTHLRPASKKEQPKQTYTLAERARNLASLPKDFYYLVKSDVYSSINHF